MESLSSQYNLMGIYFGLSRIAVIVKVNLHKYTYVHTYICTRDFIKNTPHFSRNYKNTLFTAKFGVYWFSM